MPLTKERSQQLHQWRKDTLHDLHFVPSKYDLPWENLATKEQLNRIDECVHVLGSRLLDRHKAEEMDSHENLQYLFQLPDFMACGVLSYWLAPKFMNSCFGGWGIDTAGKKVFNPASFDRQGWANYVRWGCLSLNGTSRVMSLQTAPSLAHQIALLNGYLAALLCDTKRRRKAWMVEISQVCALIAHCEGWSPQQAGKFFRSIQSLTD